MPLKAPDDLLGVLNNAINYILSDNPLNPAARRRIADNLAEVCNYVSASSRKPSLINAVHIISAQNAQVAAQNAAIEKQLEADREVLHKHQRFVENSFDKAEQYFKAIQLGGYAAFFALWSLTKEWLHPMWASIAAVLMIISVSTFVIWEVYKSTLLALILKRDASLGTGKLEDFITTRMSKLLDDRSGILAMTRSRATVWVVSVLSAAVGTGVLLWQLLGTIARRLIE
jgi:hypothetical protein